VKHNQTSVGNYISAGQRNKQLSCARLTLALWEITNTGAGLRANEQKVTEK
jgi:hypothetical protein